MIESNYDNFKGFTKTIINKMIEKLSKLLFKNY